MDGYTDRHAIQSVSEIDVLFWPETALGEVPTTPDARQLTRVSFTLDLKQNKYVTARQRASRRVDKITTGGRHVEGSLQDELSMLDHDALLEAALCGTWTAPAPVTGAATVSADAGTVTRTSGSWVASGFAPGIVASLSGFTNTDNAGTFTVISATDLVLTLDGDLADESAEHATVAVAGSILRDGKVRRSFGFEVARSTLSEGAYERSTGVRVNSLALTANNSGVATVNYSLWGIDGAILDTATASSASAPRGGDLLAPVNGEVLVDGDSVGVLTTFDVNVANGIQGTAVLGSRTVLALPNGKLQVSGSIAALLDSPRFMRAWHDNAKIAISLRINTEDGSGFISVLLPVIELTDCSSAVTGEGAATVSAQFTAIESKPHDAVILIQRSNSI